MDAITLKEEILNRELIPDILSELGCHHIQDRGDYYSCGNADGDNPRAIVVYKNEYIGCTNYTRQITKNGRSADIFDLIAFVRDCSFPEAMKFVCEIAGLDFYSDKNEEVPESLQILRMLKDMSIGDEDEEDVPVKPISEKILSYYLPYPNKMWEDEGISLEVQQEVGVGYCPQSNRITIPIRTPLGDLCGIKGRLMGEPDEYNPKYLYLQNVAKSQLLFGLYENREYIKNSNQLFLVEAEKSVLKCMSNGVRNCVALGGKSISRTQAELIIRTGCTPIIALDQGIEKDEIYDVASIFPDNIPVYYIYDTDNILAEKEAPCDDFAKFRQLIKNNIYAI